MFTSRIGFLNLFSFEIPLLKKMEQRHINYLFFSYLLTLISSCLLMGFSASYILLMVPNVSWTRLLTASGIFVVVSIFMLNLERLFVAIGAYPLNPQESPISEIHRWKPDQLQKICIGLLSIIFALPILLLINKEVLDVNVGNLTSSKANAYERSELQKSQDRQSEILRKKVLIQEQINRFQYHQSNSDGFNQQREPDASNSQNQKKDLALSKPTHRKALVIGVENYVDKKNNVAYAINDARSVATELRRIGFEVTTSEDETADQIRLKINAYVKSLEKDTDYSLVYYAGHGFQINDQNYVTAADMKVSTVKDLEESSINIKKILRDISSKGPLLNMIILDSCRSFFGQELKGLAPFEISDEANDYILFTATEPGRLSRSYDSLKHGAFTYALLQSLALSESVFSIMPKVTAMVVDISTKAIKSDPYCLQNPKDKDNCGVQHPEYKTNSTNANYQLLAVGYPKTSTKDKKTKKNKEVDQTPVSSLNSLDDETEGNNLFSITSCSAFKTSNTKEKQSMYLNCLYAENRVLEEGLKQEDNFQKHGLQVKKEWYINTLLSYGMLDERIRNMFFTSPYIQKKPSNKTSLFNRYQQLLTVILNFMLLMVVAAVLYSGVLLRYSYGPLEARREYEKLRYLQSHLAIANLNQHISDRVDFLMSRFKAYSSKKLPKFEIWDESIDFYKKEKTELFVPSVKVIDSKETYERFISNLTPTL